MGSAGRDSFIGNCAGLDMEGAVTHKEGPLNFNLTQKGLAITGFTASRDELVAFAKRLLDLAEYLPKEPPHEP